MVRHLLAVLAAFPALVLLWHSTAFASLHLLRETRPPEGFPDGPPSEWAPVDVERYAGYTTSYPWESEAVGSLCFAAVVVGFLLASGGLSPLLGLLVGLPVLGAGLAGLLSADAAAAVTEALPTTGAGKIGLGDTAHGVHAVLRDGTYVLLGAALLAAAATALRPARRLPPPFWPGVGAGVAAGAAAWSLLFLSPWQPAGRAVVLILAGAVLGYVAASRFPPRTAALAAGLPPAVLGLREILDGAAYWPAHADGSTFAHRDALLGAGDVPLLLGGALVVAALAPWRRLPLPAAPDGPAAGPAPLPGAAPRL